MSQENQLFGLVIPGHAVRTDFVRADPSGLKYTLTLHNISNPSLIADIVFFLLPGAQLLPSHGAILYWQFSNAATFNSAGSASGFEMLGAVAADRPSGVFRTGWGQNEPLLAALDTGGNSTVITLGISLEDLGNIRNLEIVSKGVEDRTNVAKKIALDLFNFLKSFDSGSAGNGLMTVPNNVFDRWMRRFENRRTLELAENVFPSGLHHYCPTLILFDRVERPPSFDKFWVLDVWVFSTRHDEWKSRKHAAHWIDSMKLK